MAAILDFCLCNKLRKRPIDGSFYLLCFIVSNMLAFSLQETINRCSTVVLHQSTFQSNINLRPPVHSTDLNLLRGGLTDQRLSLKRKITRLTSLLLTYNLECWVRPNATS